MDYTIHLFSMDLSGHWIMKETKETLFSVGAQGNSTTE